MLYLCLTEIRITIIRIAMIDKKMRLQANCQTTAMGIMPHTDVERALQLALSLDIPFFPQLPNTGFYEDMYVQASQHFPPDLMRSWTAIPG